MHIAPDPDPERRMLPEPLHPAVVHFPIVFAACLPFAALVALWAIRRGADRAQTWFVPVVVAVAMMASGWFAKETGEDQEDAVEEVVGEAPIHEHEEAAERFLLVGGVTTLVLAGGLAAGAAGTAARVVGTLASFLVLAAGIQVGDLGGELVYEHGAANAYLEQETAEPPAPEGAGGDAEERPEGSAEERGSGRGNG